VADVGFGESPVTVRELWDALVAAGREVEIVGIERETGRVDTARREAPELRFELGGFEQLAELGPFDVIRVANVLRAYRANEVPAAHAAITAALAPGGFALEGSSDTEGHVSTWYVLRPGPVRERLVFHTDFARGFSPKLFRDWLPSEYRRNLSPDSALARFLEAWRAAWEAVRTESTDLAATFTATASSLASSAPTRFQVDAHGGFLEWCPPEGVPAPTGGAPSTS
jgi:hypothetical protein